MNTTVQVLQRRLIALGFQLPLYGPDGDPGTETLSAVNKALDELVTLRGVTSAIPAPIVAPAASMTTSAAGRKAITDREGNRLTAYQDGGGVWTIGVGHTSAAGDPVVTKGLKITAAQSDEILSRDLKDVEKAVLKGLKVPVTQNQFDALVSLAFNIGNTAFTKTTLLKKLNAGDRAGAADQFLVWSKDNGKVVQGLVNRRKSERLQFLS
jgi:lysozyme